jgi:hypothetical protein
LTNSCKMSRVVAPRMRMQKRVKMQQESRARGCSCAFSLLYIQTCLKVLYRMVWCREKVVATAS